MPLIENTIKTTSSALSLCLLLGACAVGPDFVAPSSPTPYSYGPDGMPMITAEAQTEHGGAQRFMANGDVPAAWWALYESPSLNHLIDLAVRKNPSLDAARASLRVAEETTAAARGNYYPQIDGNASVQRSKSSGSTKPYSVHSTSVSVSYVPDVFGSTSRAVEALEATQDSQRFELEAAYLSLTGNVVTTAIQEASLREQISATKEILAAQQKQYEMMKTQFEVGAIARQTLLAQQTTIASTQATIPPLEQQLAATRTQMSVLLGQLPSESYAVSFDLSSLKLPTNIPLSLPSKLVEQRPDIQASLAQLHAANANVGVAMAAMFPQFSLTGSYGVAAASVSDMFSPTTALWGLAAGLTQPIFRGGELLHTKKAKEAAFDQAAAQYRGVVLSAFKDVADSLKALESDAQTLKAQLEAERAASESLALTTEQFNAGAVNAIDLLNAQASYQQAKISLIKAKAARLSDTAALLQALGGGWWQREGSIATPKEEKKTP